MFWNNFYNLCRAQHQSPTEVVEALGIARGSITKWKNGTLPSMKNLLRIADYFKVPVERLLAPKIKKAPRANEELMEKIFADPSRMEFVQLLPLLPDEYMENLLKIAKAFLERPKK